MGIPYSRQINAAFEEVTPLVAAGFRVLRTSRNISFLLAVIQILNLLLLTTSLFLLIAVVVSVNPDLKEERQAIVTPFMRWLVAWLIDRAWLRILLWGVLSGAALGGYAGWYYVQDTPEIDDETSEDDTDISSI